MSSSPSFTTVLRCCLLAGLLAGLLAAVVSLTVVEPAMAPALQIEEARGAAEPDPDHDGAADHDHEEAGAAAHSHDAELVPRPVQVAGGALVAVLAGLLAGSVFAVAFALLRSRLPGRTDLARAAVLAATGWAAVALLPALHIPANPPAVGDGETVGLRTAIWAGTVVTGVLVAAVAGLVHRRLRAAGTAQATRVLAAAATAAVLVVAALVLLPASPDGIPADVPADVVWDFRLASLAQLTTLWGVLGLAAGGLLTRAARREGLPERPRVPAGV